MGFWNKCSVCRKELSKSCTCPADVPHGPMWEFIAGVIMLFGSALFTVLLLGWTLYKVALFTNTYAPLR